MIPLADLRKQKRLEREQSQEPVAAAAEGEEEAEEEEEGSGCSIEERAERYLREAMEGAARAVEPARLEAVGNWQAERRRRRLLQNQLQELKGSIRVMCRVRPTAAGEGAAVVTIPTPTDVLVAQPGTREGRRSFAFDQAFGPGSGQEAVFEEVGRTDRPTDARAQTRSTDTQGHAL